MALELTLEGDYWNSQIIYEDPFPPAVMLCRCYQAIFTQIGSFKIWLWIIQDEMLKKNLLEGGSFFFFIGISRRRCLEYRGFLLGQ